MEDFTELVSGVRDYAVFLLDSQGCVLSWNTGAERIKGYRAEEIIGRHFSTFYPPAAVASGWPDHELKVADRTGRFEDEGWRLRKDGSRFWASVVITALRNPDGSLRGFLKITRDQTDRKQAEEKLRLSEERFRLLVEGVNDHAIFMLDPEGRVVTWNAGAQRLKGYTAHEIIGRHFSCFYPEEAGDWPAEELRRAARDGRLEDEGWRLRKDGTRFWANVVITALRDDNGQLRGFAKLTRDLTERRRALRSQLKLAAEEAARKAAEDAADELDRQREELRVTLASIGDAVIATDAEGRVSFLNAVAEKLTGWPQSEATGQPLDEVFRIVHEESRHPMPNPALRALRDRKVVGLANHTVLLTRGGGEVPIEDSAAPILTASGEITGVVLVFRDVSEARRALEARLFLAAIVESSDDAIIGKTLDGLVASWNQGAERLYGYRAEEMVGRPLDVLVPPEYPDELPAIMARVRSGERIEHYETERLRKDGSRVSVSLTISPVRNREGRVIGVSKIARDITPQKLAQQRLRQSEEHLRNIFEQSTAAIAQLDQEGRFVMANRCWCHMTGYGLPELRELTLAHLTHPDYEDRYIRKDGSVVWVQSSQTRMGDDLLVVAVDITSRVQAQQALHRHSERFRLLWESAAVMLSTQAPEEMLNELFIRLKPHLGLDAYVNYMFDDRDQLRLTSWAGVSAEQILEPGLSLCAQAVSQRRPVVYQQLQQSDLETTRAARQLGLSACYCHPLLAEGRLLGTLAFTSRTRQQFEPDELELLETISQYVTVAYERIRLVEQLKEADRRKDQFLATLAHELRNPLAPLRNGLQVLKLANIADPTVEESRTVMERQLGQMVHLIDDLLDLSRISRGKITLQKQRVELKKIVESALETSGPVIEASGHDLILDLGSQALWVDADVTRIAQVLANLLNNAAKFTPRGGRITLSVRPEGQKVAIAVRDTGVGIPANMLPHVFEVFTQVDRSLERSQGGLGIGLSLVKGLVELHGGRVDVHSEGDGQGSEFTVRLPLAPVPAAVAPAPAATGSALPRRKILVVDDNEDSAMTMAMMFKLMKHEVRKAHDGLQAVETAAEYRPELILMDIGMPGMNGYDACRHIRQQEWGKKITIVALTGWGQEEDKRQSREAGFDSHLVKPVEPAALERLVAGLR